MIKKGTNKHVNKISGCPSQYGYVSANREHISQIIKVDTRTEKARHLKTNTVSVIMGALGMIKKGTNKHVNKISGCLSQYEIQKNCT